MPEIEQKKKILYLITQSNFGGAQKYVFDMATNLDRQKYDIAVAAGGNGELFTQLERKGIRAIKLRWLGREAINPLRDIFGLIEIYRLFKKEKPDVVHLNSSKAGFSGSIAAKMAGIKKVVYTVHGAVFEASFSWFTRKFFLLLEKISSPFKDKIICVSGHDHKMWLSHKAVPQKKLVIIHNGINLYTNFLTKEEARQALLPKLDASKNYRVVGWMGYFYPEKNLSTLIKAANLIFRLPDPRFKNIIFAIMGDGPQEKILKDRVIQLGIQDRFLFLGAIPNGKKYLKAFDAYAFPSTKEGLPYGIGEPMAAGLPIVASNVGGIPEMIEDGKNGFLIKPLDFEALAEKILQLLENQEMAKNYVQASLIRIKEFSLEKMVSETERQY